MIGCVGDLVEDIGVELGGPVNVASDTDVVVSRRRGGSAANTAVVAASIEGQARFIGCVGSDPLGDALVAQLGLLGVEVVGRRQGRTGSILLLIDERGERTMLSDRGSAADLVDPDRSWLAGLGGLHVPFYSLAQEPLAATCMTLIAWARVMSLTVSVDVSSTAVIKAYGLERFVTLMAELGPDIVFANEAEAELVGVTEISDVLAAGAGEFVVHGPRHAAVLRAGQRVEVRAIALGVVTDTTGAGDAFAAGYLVARVAGADPLGSAHAGHRAAHDHLVRGRSRPRPDG